MTDFLQSLSLILLGLAVLIHFLANWGDHR